MSPEIAVRLKNTRDRSYTIVIRPGILQSLSRIVAQRWKRSKLFIITDSNVEKNYGADLQRRFSSGGLDSVLLSFGAGEKYKNARTVQGLQTKLLSNGIRRDSLIVALGGGVVGDVAGYAAATILRGVAYIQVPSTLLSQVDSSVGGKVGIDHPLGKNLIGAFHQPSAVFIDPNTLSTLSEKEFRNGLAEVVKIAVALDKSFFTLLERNATRLSRNNRSLLTQIIARSVGLKAAVVEKDEFESGLRKALNLGHTIGHALEAASGFTLKHGEAVALGIIAEAGIALRIGLLRKQDYLRVIQLMKQLKLPTRLLPIKSKRKFFSSMATDKKSEGDTTRFVLLNGIGRSVIGVPVSREMVEECLYQT